MSQPIKLSPAQKQARDAFLNDLFAQGGLIRSKRTVDYNIISNGVRSGVFSQAEVDTVCNGIVNREVTLDNFNNIDQALDHFSRYKMYPTLHNHHSRMKITTDQFTSYIADFCMQQKLYWDDISGSISEQEFDTITNQTALGRALYADSCFVSQPNAEEKVKAKRASATQSTGTTNTTGNAAGNTTGPKIGYKQSGAHSGDIPNLIGTPGQKISQNGYMYSIEADKTGKNVPNAYITPLKVSAKAVGVYAVSRVDAEAVNFGSGNGYTDCKCWFNTSADADNFLIKCQNKFGNKFTNMHVVKAGADSNGYYEVSTEFGHCFIKANKLNEELTEDITESEAKPKLQKQKKYTTAYKIENIDAYDEAFHKYE